MSLTSENGGGMVMPVSPMYGNGGFGGGFGGDWGWIILLLLCGWGGGYGMGGFGGGLGIDFPWLLNGQQGINNNVSDGFRDQMIQTSIASVGDKVSSGFGDLQTSLCSGFAGVNATVNGAQNAISQQLYTNQIADMERSFAAQTASTAGMSALQAQLAQCCCDNRAATADVKYTIATENCADRAAISDGIRDLLAANNASTQRILDQLCADKIEQKNDTIAQLRSELMYARGQASQDVQTAAIQAGQRALANEVEQYVLPTPRPAYIVQNPNCCTGYNGCGCGCGVA